MPFTLAHPIAALPLWWGSRRRLDLAALMVGATVPDISYFIALQPTANIGHRFSGIFLEGLPSGLVLLFLGRYLLWQPVRALLPPAVSKRFPERCPYRFWPISRFGLMVLSLYLGASTHIVWDSFTHAHGWSVKRLSGLSLELLSLPLYKWLQYSGGIVGLVLLLFWAYGVWRTLEPCYRPSTLSIKWKGLAGCAIALTITLTVVAALMVAASPHSLSTLIVSMVVGAISGCFLGLCLYAVSFWLLRPTA